jgi:glycosyltransferase involved in cell wall biosynthesis
MPVVEPLRITFVLSHADLSGGVRVVAVYARKLAEGGHTVTVVSRPFRKPTLRERLRVRLKGGVLPSAARTVGSHLDGLTGVTHKLVDGYRPITAADVPDADVVVATWWETAEWVAAFPASKGAKAYFIQHYETHAGLPAERVEATWRLPMHKIVIARWLDEIARHRFNDRRASLVPNAVDRDQFHAPPRDKQPSPTVGVMYSHVPFKGCDIALKAFAVASSTVPGLRLVAFGHRATTETLPLPPGTDYVVQPAQDRIRELYARCDAWLFASRSEGFGLPILEAMACRTPVIATPAGAAPELVGEGGGGTLVPPEDPQAMADAIVRIARLENAAWRSLSDKAYATASRYTWDDATALFEAALRRAMGRSDKAAVA